MIDLTSGGIPTPPKSSLSKKLFLDSKGNLSIISFDGKVSPLIPEAPQATPQKDLLQIITEQALGSYKAYVDGILKELISILNDKADSQGVQDAIVQVVNEINLVKTMIGEKDLEYRSILSNIDSVLSQKISQVDSAIQSNKTLVDSQLIQLKNAIEKDLSLALAVMENNLSRKADLDVVELKIKEAIAELPEAVEIAVGDITTGPTPKVSITKEGQTYYLNIEFPRSSTTVSGGGISKSTVDKMITEALAGYTPGGGITEAPIDGTQYARKDGAWSVVVTTSGAGGPTSWGNITGNLGAQVDLQTVLTSITGVNLTQDTKINGLVALSGSWATYTLVQNTSGALQTNITSLSNTLDSFKTQVVGTTGNLQTQINAKVSADILRTEVAGMSSVLQTNINAKLSDAPSDGTTYGRKNNTWTAIVATSGSSGPITRSVGWVVDGGSSVPTSGTYATVEVPFSGTITNWSVIGDISGSAVVNIWKAAGTPPIAANSIVASAKPTLSGQKYVTSSTLSGWNTSISSGDLMTVHLESASLVKRVTVQLKVTA